ncbi:hypothetical protein LSM04_002420 [Trypanosoma melophagium]|uniref:uncharacterized protein n=1 Tax=Trypanosoma melophagium TaxID=715481 RepID=UPI003519EF69|nr:hypothetical protein LSM04_002420 [Trypanosoma melophagium]
MCIYKGTSSCNSGTPTSDRSLEVIVDRLSGSFCAVVLAHNLPRHTNVTIRDSTIVMTGPVSYARLSGLTDAVAAPLLLFRTKLSQSQLRVENSVLRTTVTGGTALYLLGNVYLLSSAVVLDGVSLEATGGGEADAMKVSGSSVLSLQNLSVFSVTNASLVSSGSGINLGNSLTVSNSVVRLVRVNANIANPVLYAGGGTIGADAWLDIYGVRVSVAAAGVSPSSPVVSLSSVDLDGGVVSIVHSVASGTTLANPPTVKSGIISVQCNRLGTKLLLDLDDYKDAGMTSVSLAPCFSCVENQRCFDALTSSFMPNSCSCSCSSGSFGPSCLPLDVPFAKTSTPPCTTDITVTESVTLGFEDSSLCFNNVTFSGPIIVTVDLWQMNTFADVVNVTLHKCLLTGGAQLIINGLNSIEEWMPPLTVNITNVTSVEGTIVQPGVLPVNSPASASNFISSDLGLLGGSVFSVQNISWRVATDNTATNAFSCKDFVVHGGSVMQFVSSDFRAGFALLSMNSLELSDGNWLLHRDCQFRSYYVLHVIDWSGVHFVKQSLWSILRNRLSSGTYGSSTYLDNYWYSPVVASSTVYGM